MFYTNVIAWVFIVASVVVAYARMLHVKAPREPGEYVRPVDLSENGITLYAVRDQLPETGGQGAASTTKPRRLLADKAFVAAAIVGVLSALVYFGVNLPHLPPRPN